MYTHLKDRSIYEDSYDKATVYGGRRDSQYFEQMRSKFFEIMPDEKEDSFRAVFHLNMLFMVLVGFSLVDRYNGRSSAIDDMMERDRRKDAQLADARLSSEPVCSHCGAVGLRIMDKMLMSREGQEGEDVLFMLSCGKCEKRTSVWEDGSVWKKRAVLCPKCGAEMSEKTKVLKKGLVTTYSCSCGHSYKDRLDLSVEKEKPDPDYEADRKFYCLEDEKARHDIMDASYRYKEMARLGKELQEKEDNKHIYDAVKEMRKPKIAELKGILTEPLEKAGYTELSFEKPEIGKDVVIGFSCLDQDSKRSDYESQKKLEKQIKKLLADTNWRLMSDGVSYRLGYLSGRLRAYEREEDLKALVMKDKKLKPKASKTKIDPKNQWQTKGDDGKDIIF